MESWFVILVVFCVSLFVWGFIWKVIVFNCVFFWFIWNFRCVLFVLICWICVGVIFLNIKVGIVLLVLKGVKICNWLIKVVVVCEIVKFLLMSNFCLLVILIWFFLIKCIRCFWIKGIFLIGKVIFAVIWCLLKWVNCLCILFNVL